MEEVKVVEQTPVAEVQPNELPEQLKAAGFNSFDEVVQLRQSAEQWKPANALIEKLNMLYRDNTPQDQIDQYLRIQSMDVAKMNHSDAVLMQMKMQRPDLSDFALEVWMEDKFGAKPTLEDFDGDERAEEKLAAAIKKYEAKMEIAGGEARQFLQGQKVQIDTNLFAQKEQERERRATLTDANMNVAVELVKTLNDIDLGFEDESGKLELKYNLRLSESEKLQMSKMITQWAVESGVNLSSKEGKEQAQAFYENYLVWADPARRIEMTKAIAKEIQAGVQEAMKKQYALK